MRQAPHTGLAAQGAQGARARAMRAVRLAGEELGDVAHALAGHGRGGKAVLRDVFAHLNLLRFFRPRVVAGDLVVGGYLHEGAWPGVWIGEIPAVAQLVGQHIQREMRVGKNHTIKGVRTQRR